MPAKLKTPCRVLIVEDNQILRVALVHLLRHLGYDTECAGTLAEGLAQLNGQQCAILDMNLPDGLGTAILERIRVENRPIRVAVATATTDDTLLAEVRRHKPDLLLHKPFQVNVLLEWLEAAG